MPRSRRLPPPPLAALFACLVLLPATAAALELRAVEVRGLADDAMRDNVDDALSLQRLNPNRRKSLSESRLSYLLRQVPRETREALEPFGYYDPRVSTELVREGEAVTVRVQVDAGEPVRVRQRQITIEGPAGSDPALARRLERLRPREGQPFHHGVYEDGKAQIDAGLAARGYFDAVLATHRVEVSRADRSADITLAWRSGERHAFGEAQFEGHPFRPGLLENLVPWRPGDPYLQADLLALQASLSELDYFSAIDIQPEPAEGDDLSVPVTVKLAPAKRSIYSAGLRYGTDTGAGITAGLERRWVNNRGHKLRSQLSLAERRNDATVQYRIPAFAWLDGWYTVSASVREEPFDFIDSQLIEVVGSRSGRIGNWELVAAMNYRRERFDDSITGENRSYSTLVYPSLWAKWGDRSDALYPRRAQALTLELRGGSAGFGSDIDFLQLRAEAGLVRSFGRRNRLLLRAEAGTTVSDEFASFPPSLRFYAGGDRSVRGYGYREIGQYFEAADGERFVFGGKHLMVVSAEVERMFNRTWGMAVFVDAGDAFDEFNAYDWEIGAGVGLRWRSPVGPVRLDLAHGLGDAAQQSVRLHLNIGPDL
ncbi:MAG TPA: autotransporter assembly complex family protein [Arenimonas sp.]|uniref:autotransporter assembly complex protein TamA n=1 Tax=Arenimonas sp. TaxID=1872635 RepID=UPI002D7EDBA9|nr:autotransporter assembly complex family protein [Arenimonas sp.]HEU0153427.1 autotransporter assembly complex family protein [Arenimonas sp.]